MSKAVPIPPSKADYFSPEQDSARRTFVTAKTGTSLGCIGCCASDPQANRHHMRTGAYR